MGDHVFISYSHKNSEFAGILKERLVAAGIDPRIDTDFLKGGAVWHQEIDDQIRTASVVLLILSPDSFESKYVTYEWAFALGNGVPVIPLMIEKTELHPRLRMIQYIDFANRWKIDEPIRQLIEAIQDVRATRAAAAAPRIIAPGSEIMLLMDRGRDEYRKKNYPRSVEIYQQALNSAGDDIKAELSAQMAYVLCKNGDLERAEELLAQALQPPREFPNGLATRGLVYSLKARRLEDELKSRALLSAAQSALETALSQQSNLLDMDDEAWYGTLGGVYKRSGNYRAAIDAYERAREVTPNASYPLSNLAQLYLLDRQIDKAKSTYRIVERLAQKRVDDNFLDYWAYNDLIAAETALGKYDEADAHLTDFLGTLRPSVAARALGSLLETLNALAAAVPEDEAAQVKPIVERAQIQLDVASG
ncbi:MAG: toll/interleukin-1 receptor domain-containing protein [Anaerolineae bacterium]|nr:toll/interleukin-1 receptor domain-containing protein [Anaerolineae bacterium]